MTGIVPHESAALTLPGDWDSRSLTMPERASLADFEHAWQSLDGADDSIRFWKGDLINQARERWGDEAEAQLYGPERANNHDNDNSYARVAKRIPKEWRSADMSWSAHKALAGVDTTLERQQFVAFAQAQEWKSKECETRVAAYKRGDARFCDPDVNPEVLDKANKAARQTAQAGSRGPVPKLVDNSSDAELADDDKPVMDSGAFGEGLSAERGDGSRPETDGFDDIERMRKVWAKMTPDLHVRFLRCVMTADLFMQIAPDFQQSPSHVEPGTIPAKAPCEAPARTAAPDISKPPAADPVGGGSLSGPGFDADGEASVPSYLREPA